MPNTTDADILDAQQAATAKKIRECACGNFADAATGERIECHAETTRTFAPGHDAKLKGLLIRAGRRDHEIRTLGEPMTQSAVTVAKRFGFFAQVADGIARGAKKTAPSDFDAMVDADVAKRQAKAAKMVRKPVEAKPIVTAKVGRWVYEGTVTDSPEWGLQFTYADKKGNSQTTTKFTRV